MTTAFVIDPRDNVATLLDDGAKDQPLALLGARTGATVCVEPIRSTHKVALAPIADGEAVVKYGLPIGRATRDIQAGEWVHLHNCASNYDERSNHLDGETGAPEDTPYV